MEGRHGLFLWSKGEIYLQSWETDFIASRASQAPLLPIINDSGFQVQRPSPVNQLTMYAGGTWFFSHHLTGFEVQGMAQENAVTQNTAVTVSN